MQVIQNIFDEPYVSLLRDIQVTQNIFNEPYISLLIVEICCASSGFHSY